MNGLTDAKPQNWEATMRAWAQEPEPSIEERLRALEEQT